MHPNLIGFVQVSQNVFKQAAAVTTPRQPLQMLHFPSKVSTHPPSAGDAIVKIKKGLKLNYRKF